MTESRTFHLGEILTVATGRFVAPSGVNALYELLTYMTGEVPFTHQLPRFAGECAGPLIGQLPFLAQIVVPEEFSGEEDLRDWLAAQIAQHGEMHPVTPIAAEAHAQINPLLELINMRGKS